MNADLIIIGAGPGGYETAIAAAQEGVQTVLIESTHLGGTCLNEGCIPTKCFCRNAEVIDTIRESALYGVHTDEVRFDYAAVLRRKEEVVAQLSSGVASLLKSPLITQVEGTAHFVNEHEVAVGDQVYHAPHIIIATGSEAKFLPIPGTDNERVVTAREMLSRSSVPARLCVIGGGVIGLEFASIFTSFGSQVTVVEYAKEVLPAFDRDIAKRLRTSLKRRGITFHVGAAVQEIKSTDGGCEVCFDMAGKSGCVEADVVLMAVGRKPCLQNLNLENAGVEFTSRGITVNEDMQTNVKGIYAIGDVNGLCPLAHAATAQGRVALSHLLGKGPRPDLQLIPAAVFTVPEVATVGLTEETAKANGIEYVVHKSFYRANGKSLAMGSSDGLVKILVDNDKHIIGAHLLGAHAADLIHELALAMHAQLSLDDLQTMVHAHPSLSELVHAATFE